MLYDEKNKAEIERVYSVFQDYIQSSPNLEWIWSDKVGYILMEISTKQRTVDESIVILNAEMLCDRLLYEICIDVLMQTKSEHSRDEIDSLERSEMEHRWKTYIDQLPEYAGLCEKQFEM